MQSTRIYHFPAVSIVLLLSAVLASAGCLVVHNNPAMVRENVISTVPKQDKTLLSTKLEAKANQAGALSVTVAGEYDVVKWEEATIERTQKREKVVVGAFPGITARWHGGATDDWVGELLLDVPILIPLANIVLLGYPTWGGWFTESSAPYEPRRSMSDEMILKNRPAIASLIGWAKTGEVERVKVTERRNETRPRTKENIPGQKVIVEFPKLQYRVDATTDRSGNATFALQEVPIIAHSPLEVVVSAPELHPATAPVRANVPSNMVGSKLAGVINNRNFAHDKIFIERHSTEPGSPQDAGFETIDFATGRPALAPRALAHAAILPQDSTRPELLPVHVTVENTGRGELYRLVGRTVCRQEPSLNDHLFIFGRLDPGARAERVAYLPVGAIDPRKSHDVEIAFSEANRYEPSSLRIRIDATNLLRPQLEWSFEIIDDPRRSDTAVGNADGVIQRGEAFDLVIAVKNMGKSSANDVQVQLELPSDNSITTHTSRRQPLGQIQPEAVKAATFNISVREWSELSRINAKVTVSEEAFNLIAERQIELPFDQRLMQDVTVINRVYYTTSETQLRLGASENANVYRSVSKDTRLYGVGETAQWVKVRLTEDSEREAWVHTRTLTTNRPEVINVVEASDADAQIFIPLPQIAFIEPQGDIVTEEERMRLIINVLDIARAITNVRVYQTDPDQTSRGLQVVPRRQEARTHSGDSRVIQETIQLAIGPNVIRVTAANEAGLTAERTLTITRVPKLGQTYAIAIGINTYAEPWTLHCARQDADAFAAFAAASFNVPEKNIVKLLDNQATRRSIMSAFGNFRRQLKSEDTLIVFLAGHGMIDTVGDREERYFVPADADWTDLFGTAIEMDQFKRMLDVPAERVIVIADACHSGDIALRGGSEEIFTPLTGQGRLLVGYQGAAREDRNLGHGYLTYYLLEGLAGPADANRDGIITFREAYDYASRKIREITGTGLWIKGEGDLELVRVE